MAQSIHHIEATPGKEEPLAVLSAESAETCACRGGRDADMDCAAGGLAVLLSP